MARKLKWSLIGLLLWQLAEGMCPIAVAAPARDSTDTDLQSGSTGLRADRFTFRDVERGSLIRVQVARERILEGPFFEARAEELAFDDLDATVVPYGDITLAWIRTSSRGTAMRQGALFGGLIGGIAGGVASFSLRETGFCFLGNCSLEGADQFFFVLSGIAFGAAYGAVTGILFGAAFGWGHAWVPLRPEANPLPSESPWNAPRAPWE